MLASTSTLSDGGGTEPSVRMACGVTLTVTSADGARSTHLDLVGGLGPLVVNSSMGGRKACEMGKAR